MKKTVVLLFSIISLSAVAQNNTKQTAAQNDQRFHFGIHTGFDLGAAVPWPISDAVGGGDKMNAAPRLTPALGFSGEYLISKKISAVAEATYKTIALDASIITLNSGQRFIDDGLNVIFYGRAKTSMSFTMLELPLYAKYKINEKNRVFLGGYYAYIVTGKFEATALSGRLENPEIPGEVTVINPSDPLFQDFGPNLSNWDAGWLAGYERKLSNRFTLSGRFSMGLKDIFRNGQNYLEYSMLNMRGTIALSYKLF